MIMLDSGLVGLTLRATLLMAIGLLVALLAERRSATISHRILAATGLCVILLPILSLFGPRWEWNCPDWLPANSSIAYSQAHEDLSVVNVAANVPSEIRYLPPGTPERRSNWTWPRLDMTIWILGSCLMLARLGYAWHRLRVSLSRCSVASDTILNEVEAIAAAFNISDRIQIMLSSRESMPMVCWFGRWILVLPSNIETWTVEVRNATLSHELGHISRRDVWVDYVIQMIGCALWWHPLVWKLKHAVTRLRELACDEWVLQTCSITARDYSHALLEVVRRCQIERWTLATPMATKDELESRLRSIASPNRSKKIKRIWLQFCAVGMAALCIGIAAFTLVRQREAASENPAMKSGGSTITGLVTHAGSPVAGIELKVFKYIEGKPNKLHAKLTTDDQGRYKITDMHPGDRYHLEVSAKGNLMVRNWQYQSPYVVTVRGAEGDTIELPDAVLVGNSQTLTGVVVDPSGNPVSGISVSANLASGQMLSRPIAGQEPWTQTDQQGRFHLTTLPEEPIELMAYKANPAGGRIIHPCKLKVELNAKDIRMVFDPRLGSGIEDLDAK